VLTFGFVFVFVFVFVFSIIFGVDNMFANAGLIRVLSGKEAKCSVVVGAGGFTNIPTINRKTKKSDNISALIT